MGQKKEFRFRNWDDGIIHDIDYADAPITSLSQCVDFEIKNSGLTALNDSLQITSISGLTDPKRAFYTRSRYKPDGSIGDMEYLYVYDRDGSGGTVVRYYRTYGDLAWTSDSSFSVSFAPPAIDCDFASIDKAVAFAGSNYTNDRFAYPYSEYRFSYADHIAGWLTSNPVNPTMYVDTSQPNIFTYLNSNPTHLGILRTPHATYAYSGGDLIQYYVSLKTWAGYETEPELIYSETDPTTVTAQWFRFHATASLAADYSSIVIYKELNGGGKYFMSEVSIQDGIIADFAGASFVEESEAGWAVSGTNYYTDSSVADNTIYNQPYDYISERKDGDKPPNSVVTSFKGRFLYGGEEGQLNGIITNAIYLSSLDGVGGTYNDNYLTIDEASGDNMIGLATFKDYILAFFENYTFVLDGSHPSPAMWKVIAKIYQGINTKSAVRETSSGIIFVNDNSAFLFNGQFNDLIMHQNKDLYDNYIDASGTDIQIGYDPTKQLILLGGKDDGLIIDRNKKLVSSSDGLFEGEVIIDNYPLALSYLNSGYLYQLFGSSTKRAGMLVSHNINFDTFDDKLLFKIRIRSYSESSTTMKYVFYCDDASIESGTVTVFGETETVIPLKTRFTNLYYKIYDFSGTVREVSFQVGYRKYSRES